MYIPKRYGQSKVDKCPFCNSQATTLNKQKLPVCMKHKNSVFEEIRCQCGSYLELRTGKFGSYYNSINCGNVNMKKALELKEANKTKTKFEYKPDIKYEKETTIRSDDPDYF